MRSFIAATAAIATLLALATTAAAQAPATAKPEEILKEVVAGMPRGERQEVRVFTATLKPGDRTPFHTHRFPVAAYVLEGAFTLELDGRPPVIVKAGEAILEPPNVRMTGFNRAAENTRIVIFYVADPGTPFLDMAHH
jgi:quercetin dioxygenase-like cupin family protein